MKATIAVVFAFYAMFAPQAHSENLEDLEAAEAAVFEIWDNMPMAVRNATLTTSPPQGFRAYFKRENSVYKPGETIFIYSEPVGFGWRNLSGNTYSINLAADVVIRDSEDEPYAELTNRLLPSVSQGRAKEFAMDYKLDVPSAPAGDYTVEIVVRDENSDKTASFELPFSIVE